MSEQKLLEEEFAGIDERGIRLAHVGGLTVWEAPPLLKHQVAIDRICRRILPVVGLNLDTQVLYICDASVRFVDGSEMRPNIALYDRKPDEDEQDSAITLIPEAVIEVISKEYEAKDYVVRVPFYLVQGVKDVLTLDPRTKEVRHYKANNAVHLTSPVEIELECGCVCTV